MPQPVSGGANFVPRLIGAKNRGLVSEPRGGFADNEKLALHGGNCLRVVPERIEIHA